MLNLLNEYRDKPSLFLKNQIVKDNIGLVKSIASKYTGDFDDLVQVGLITLSDCIDKFDQAKGAFSTYATRSIHNRLINHVTRNQALIKTPKGKRCIIEHDELRLVAKEINFDKLDDILNNLTKKERVVFFSYLGHGDSPNAKESKVLNKIKELL